MAEEKDFRKLLKKIDMSDIRLLAVGVALLIVPVVFLFFFSGGSSKKISQEKMKTMVARKNVFNFGSSSGSGASSTPSSGKTSGSTWFSSTSPEKRVEQELEDAFKLVKRSQRSDRFPPGSTEEQRDAYKAEHCPMLLDGRGELERGNFAEAEAMFLKAFEEANGNAFQQVYAMGALCELYELTQDRKKLEAAFKQFMELVGKLPPDYGGGDLAASVRNAYMALKQLQDSADPAKVAQGLANVEAIKQGAIQPGKVSQGLGKSLFAFPAKFE